MRNCKYLCLVGGLSTSKYYRSRMSAVFGSKSRYNMQLIMPQRPILSVVEGAAYFGITPNYIKARVLQYTYGYSVSKLESIAQQIASLNISKRIEFIINIEMHIMLRICLKCRPERMRKFIRDR